jgi:two-component system nitrate/nitrite response regulator NarL
MENKKIHIIIADDHVLFIDGLKLLLKGEADISIEDVANDGMELMDLLRTQTADIILLDINMPKLNGLDALRHIKQSYPSIKIIILSTYNEDHLIQKAKEHGANGYQLKNCSKDELLQTMRLVYSGHSCFPYRQGKQTNEFDEKDNFLKQFKLTKREIEILQLIKHGYTNQEVADKLFLALFTIETHRKNIMQKLGLNKPAALIKFIVENNL